MHLSSTAALALVAALAAASPVLAQELDPRDHGRPVAAVAAELGVTPEAFREAFRLVTPAGPGRLPTTAQRNHNRQALAAALGVSPERLDAVMDKYRPGGATGQR